MFRLIAPSRVAFAFLFFVLIAVPSFGQKNLNTELAYSRRTSTPSRIRASRSEEGRIKPVRARIGQIAVEEVAVRAGLNGAGKELTYLAKDQYIAIVAETPDYVGVMMEDKSVGWINRLAVHLLDYEITLFQTVTPGAARDTSTDNKAVSRGVSSRTAPDDADDAEENDKTRTPRRSASESREIVIPANVKGLIEEAVSYLGVPYHWGGTTRSGLDCSAFLQNVFATQGVRLPRVSRDQATVGEPVSWKELQPGDRLYFTMGKETVTHCGIYIAEGYFIHSSTNKRGVAVDMITTPSYYNSLVAIRRSL